MAYKVTPETGEEVQLEIELDLSKKARRFAFAVSNRAIYVPRVKLIAKTDPFYFQRVPLKHLEQITVKRLRPYALWVLALIMVVVGFFTTIWMMEPLLRNVPGRHEVTGWPISVFVCGFLVPFVARKRFGLRVSFVDGKYFWKPPLVVDKASRQAIAQTLEKILEACRKVGAKIRDERVR
jgi:hypothetical protein